MICSKCNRDLPKSSFPFRNKGNNKLRAECKDCNRELQQKIYNRNKEYIDNWKKQGCLKCGEMRIYLIDAHHIDPTIKDKNLSKLKINCSLEKIQKELDKCIPLCSNCHREFHYLEQTQNLSIDNYL